MLKGVFFDLDETLIGWRHFRPVRWAPRVPSSALPARRTRKTRIHTGIAGRISRAGRTAERTL